jgi:DNA-binding MarR family transcriptional regulator
VVLVLRHLTSYLRQQLMRRAVPFVAPGSQVFLPTAWVDLRERFARDRETKRATLSAAAQVVVLYHLLKAPVEGQSLRELAPKLGYSAMTLSKVADELASVELCRAETKSRSRMLCLTGARRELWERARPFLRSPVRARHWVVWNEPPPEARAAGLTALAARSMIADDRLPVFALNERDYRRLLESGRIRGCPGPDEAAAQVECWAYNPVLLGDEKAVDALSLVLSLADSPDERVQKALREVEATVW